MNMKQHGTNRGKTLAQGTKMQQSLARPTPALIRHRHRRPRRPRSTATSFSSAPVAGTMPGPTCPPAAPTCPLGGCFPVLRGPAPMSSPRSQLFEVGLPSVFDCFACGDCQLFWDLLGVKPGCQQCMSMTVRPRMQLYDIAAGTTKPSDSTHACCSGA
jgi:hypothetical protein